MFKAICDAEDALNQTHKSLTSVVSDNALPDGKFRFKVSRILQEVHNAAEALTKFRTQSEREKERAFDEACEASQDIWFLIESLELTRAQCEIVRDNLISLINHME